MISRRGVIFGLIAAPIVVRPGLLMPVKPLILMPEPEPERPVSTKVFYNTYSYKLKYDPLKRTIYDEVTQSSWDKVTYQPAPDDPDVMVVVPAGEPVITITRQYHPHAKPLEGPSAEILERDRAMFSVSVSAAPGMARIS